MGDSVDPSADGFETYGVTGVALVTFILMAVPDSNPTLQALLLIWIFVVRAAMILAAAGAYLINSAWAQAKFMLEDNDGAGNTFKATAKPVLIGTAVVGATTMIFSIIIALTEGLSSGLENLSLLHAPFLLGLITGGAVIYWFSGASIQAVTTGANRAVAYISVVIGRSA